jgi:hypothetical protein
MYKLAAVAIAAILSLGIIVMSPLNIANAADKTINCEPGCKINFKGKNNVDIQFGGAGQGEKGDTGETGQQGEVGPAGEQGIQGETGAAGLDGVNGTNGVNGTQGPEGPQGPAGTAANGTIISDQDYSDLQTVLQMLRNGTLSAEITEVPPIVEPPVDNGTAPVDNGTIPIPEPNPDEPPVDNGTNVDNGTTTDNGTSNNGTIFNGTQ